MGKLYKSLPDKSFIKMALEGEDEELVEQLLEAKIRYENETDKDRKNKYREQLGAFFWQIHRNIMLNMDETTPIHKKLLVRYNLLDMRYLTPEHQQMIKNAKINKEIDEPIYYIDEWIIEVKKGNIKPSSTDEVPTKKLRISSDSAIAQLASQQKVKMDTDKYERKKGAWEAEFSNLKEKVNKRNQIEQEIDRIWQQLKIHSPIAGLENIEGPYTEDQKKALSDLFKLLRELEQADKALETQVRVTLKLKEEFDKLEEEMEKVRRVMEETSEGEEEGGYQTADKHTLETEYDTLRQMIKMCVGRKGNHFPVLMSIFLQKPSEPYNFRENVVEYLKEIEGIDPEVFKRVSRGVERRIMPYIILTPGYGNFGVCWEPYDKYNKATSRGRIAIPIFAKEPKNAIVIALGDFRWLMAKELAAHHWMEEGLTGDIYDYYTRNKLKGDIKYYFIEFYMLWILKEAQGVQKLPKEIREIFWRRIPFPKELKEKLSKMGYYYGELYKRDQTKEMYGL